MNLENIYSRRHNGAIPGMKLTLLGTGTPTPSLKRASSSYLFEIGSDVIVMDHGPGAHNRLLEAGKSPGSPQMDTFGPNMSLARDLVEKGERETVLQYFELCRKFWKLGQDRLDQWTKDVRAGQMPDFGANLLY